jgi:hypothetical protein
VGRERGSRGEGNWGRGRLDKQFTGEVGEQSLTGWMARL